MLKLIELSFARLTLLLNVAVNDNPQTAVIPVLEVLVVVLVRVINLFFRHPPRLVRLKPRKLVLVIERSSESRVGASAISSCRLPLTIQTAGAALIGQSGSM